MKKYIETVFDKAIKSILNLVYSKEKKIERYVLGLTLAGFVLRFIAALNLNAMADDMIKASQAAGIIGSGVLSTSSHPALYYYLTDLTYRLIGYSTLASRFWPLVFGTLLIPITFLITKKLFNSKVGLASTLFVTLSSFIIRMTVAEETLIVVFFVFFAVYAGMIYLENKKFEYLILSSVLFGLGSLSKYSAPFFILSFILFAAYYLKIKEGKWFKKDNLYPLLVLFSFIIILSAPFLIFNYYLYQQKGIVDIYFSRVFHVEKAQQMYSSLSGQDSSIFQNLFNSGNYVNYSLIYMTDVLMLIFSIIGIYLLLRRKEKMPLVFFFILLIIPFILQSAGSYLVKHFVFMYIMFSIPAGYGLVWAFDKLKNKWLKTLMLIIVIGFLVINLGSHYGTSSNLFSSSDTSSLKQYLNNNVKNNDLVIFDPRIYTAKIFWFATPNHFLILNEVPQIVEYNKNFSQQVPVTYYYIECAIQDCGWGWVSQNQEFNQSSEQLSRQIINISRYASTITGSKSEGNELYSASEVSDVYKVYKGTIMLNSQLLQQTDSIHGFYFAPYMYKNENLNPLYISASGITGIICNIGLAIIFIAMALAILSALIWIVFL